MLSPAYSYRATVARVVDGDTLELAVDLGFRLTMRTVFRLHGINCPEMSTPEGRAARDWTSLWCGARTTVIADTFRAPDRYARWLAEIIDPDSGQSLNKELVAAGHAVVYLVGGT